MVDVVAQHQSEQTFVEFKVSNDFMFSTDHYFSNGLQLRVYGDFLSKSPINYILLPNSKTDNTYYALTITQNIYTPTKIFTTEIQYHDQPYAAYLLLGNRKESYNLNKKLKKVSEFQLGVLGSYAGGRILQNSIHTFLPTSDPAKGWENQVANDLAIQYMASFEKGLINHDVFELNAYASGIVGNPHTELSLGTYLRIGRFENFFSGNGMGYGKHFQVYVFGGGEITYMAYNAVLQGGMFNQGEIFNVDKINYFLAYSKIGVAIVYKSVKLEVAQEMLSPQFEGGSRHLWGNAKIVVGF